MRSPAPRTTHLSPFFALFSIWFFFFFRSFLIDAVFGIGDFSMDGERALGHKVNLILFYWMTSDQTTMGPVSHRGPSEALVASKASKPSKPSKPSKASKRHRKGIDSAPVNTGKLTLRTRTRCQIVYVLFGQLNTD